MFELTPEIKGALHADLEQSKAATAKYNAKLEEMRQKRLADDREKRVQRLANRSIKTEDILSQINGAVNIELNRQDELVIAALKRLTALDLFKIVYPATRRSWKGTCSELLGILTELTPVDYRELFPQSVCKLGRSLRRVQLFTSDLFEVKFYRSGGRNLVSVTVYREKHLKSAAVSNA